ncbi:MAG: hypothetical protein UT42_C0014G0013 [Candidatus Falkowbacteria bacterium GW2011_GWA2_39_24]|uniref:CDP-2,3-bis-(O-geranylgeranyl)-sn-glycerol synthase n=1 Tax=Candidatus Falkowbacteria bacterium GW2011_GWA2_39_24 TaxID=1618634 RepID=A0A0G0NHE9_9BACT|nr:MAG: hypothetical protein UT42_C0014G0013 [Candidatus Falkowbacteria bacterium GW2011_GWA2_39_24]
MHYLYLLYLALPCFVANALPVIFHGLNLLPGLKQPLDNGLLWRGSRLLDDHKTVRGLLVGVAGAILVSLVQWLLAEARWVPVPDLSGWLFVVYGFLAGLGAIGGDALESLIKRRLNIKSGDPLIILDQLDYIIGFLLLTSLILAWSWNDIMFLMLFSLVVHPISNMVAYIFKIKKTYW